MNKEIFLKSKEVMPGGVNSPVRAFNGMGINPKVIKKGYGVILEDEDSKEYIDFVLAWGPMILGHSDKDVVNAISNAAKDSIAFGAPTKGELQMAEFLCDEIESLEMIRMVNSGTEATMSAIKLARGWTKRDKIVKFAGCYHGHFDGFLIEAGSGVLTEGIKGSLGVPDSIVKNTVIAKYNDEESIKEIFEKYGDEIACVIIEPIAGNMGVIKAKDSFMKFLRAECDKNGSLLIFDEVMSGFRASYLGASKYFDEKPDLVTYAKIIGGGLPCGVYGGRKDIMESLAPLGGVYQAGTMSGNPVVVAAGLATLNKLKDNKEVFYKHIDEIGAMLENGVKEISDKYGINVAFNRIGGMMTIFFTDEEVIDTFEKVKECNSERFKRYFLYMMDKGFNIPPSQFEALFLSVHHNKEHIEKFLKAYEEFCIEESK
ncbi:glutamate-1-semialdehyde 2,1-aminomutase [uncultured Clostridium sp.]|uniref:glutamate-1-semialdehyde 2,1-aminomutase n=1 Tax=uncultured Clostridium sp. TaxID=59620 RepID=UPI0026206AC7|nr:glutamate-1-semialdehyde 2,1-aminomutase [uncultured Clostridium sp.]